MGKVATFNGAQIVVRTRDHCDPHVHAIHKGEGWEFKIFFSYVDDLVQAEIPPKKGKPKNDQIQECMNKVTDELDECRKIFARVQACICLQNKYVRLVNGEIRGATKNMQGALLVKTAKYNALNKSVTFTAGNTQYTGDCP